jgi:hypothetical protein
MLPSAYTFESSDAGTRVVTGLVPRAKGNQTLTITDSLMPPLSTTANILIT